MMQRKFSAGFIGLAVLGVVLAACVPPTGAGSTCAGQTVTKPGTPGVDVINGTKGDDVISGGGGDDIIRGKGGSDTICGGAGNDIIYGNKGKDTIYGDEMTAGDQPLSTDGSDHIFPGGGIDTVKGGGQGGFGDTVDYRSADGNWVINLSSARAWRDPYVNKKDTISGFENAWGTNGVDAITGTPGRNYLYGGDAKDKIDGGGGDDGMWGGGDGDGDVCIGNNIIRNPPAPGTCGGIPPGWATPRMP